MAQPYPASNPQNQLRRSGCSGMSQSRGRRGEPCCGHSLRGATNHPAQRQLLRCGHLPAQTERVPEAAHPAPRNKQGCYERQGGVCPRRHFSSSPFQARRSVPLPAPPTRSISHTSAFAQCQPLQLPGAAPARCQDRQGRSLARGCPAPSGMYSQRNLSSCWQRCWPCAGPSSSGCALQGITLSSLVTRCQQWSSRGEPKWGPR